MVRDWAAQSRAAGGGPNGVRTGRLRRSEPPKDHAFHSETPRALCGEYSPTVYREGGAIWVGFA